MKRNVLKGGTARTALISVALLFGAAAMAAAQCCASPAGLRTDANLAADRSKVADFTVPTLDNSSFTLSQQLGKPVVLYFMAYWCPTCVPEASALGKLKTEYGDRISVVALDVDPSSKPKLLANFRKTAGNPGYTFAFDTEDRVARQFGVQSLETTIIVGPSGDIAARWGHSVDYGTLKAEIDRLLSGETRLP
jgi:peroxiredoxin